MSESLVAPTTEPFTLREVCADALRGMREDWGAHLGWNVMWVAFAGISCCAFTMMLAVVGGVTGAFPGPEDDPSAGTQAMTGMLVVVYALLTPMMFALYALHVAVTMVIARARARGTPVTMRDAVVQGLARTPALGAHIFLRTLLEALPLIVVYALIGGAVWATLDPSTGGSPFERISILGRVAIGVGYVGALVLAFAYRALFGLSFPAIVDGAGPIAAFGLSHRLLRGRRWQFVGFRVAVIAAYAAAYGVCVGPFLIFSLTFRGDPTAGLVALPLMLAFYGVALFLFVLDAIIEATYHARVTRPLDAAEVARTFE